MIKGKNPEDCAPRASKETLASAVSKDGFGNGMSHLSAIEGVSILGRHNGILDDDIFELLTAA